MRINHQLIWTVVMVLMINIGWASSLYHLANAQQQAQLTHLFKDLRCLVCQNQDLADSNADFAKDVRAQVYRMVQAGKTDAEIINYLTARYGDFILFKPPVKSLTWLLWFGPVIFLMLGLLLYWRSLLRSTAYE